MGRGGYQNRRVRAVVASSPRHPMAREEPVMSQDEDRSGSKPDPKHPADRPPGAKEFAIEEYRGWLESMHRSEEIGEKRLEFFIAFTTAVLGAVLALAKGAHGSDVVVPAEAIKLARWALPLLVVLGFLTFLRMLRRDSRTDLYKNQLKQIRVWFASSESQRYDEDHWPPWRHIEDYKRDGRVILHGGLTAVMLAINAMLFGLWL